jgi:hypothetical protein
LKPIIVKNGGYDFGNTTRHVSEEYDRYSEDYMDYQDGKQDEDHNRLQSKMSKIVNNYNSDVSYAHHSTGHVTRHH